MAAVGTAIAGTFSIDPSDQNYQSYRNMTRTGLEIASLVTSGYGMVRGAISGYGAMKIANIAAQHYYTLNRFHNAAYNVSEVGQNNIRILRKWAKSKWLV